MNSVPRRHLASLVLRGGDISALERTMPGRIQQTASGRTLSVHSRGCEAAGNTRQAEISVFEVFEYGLYCCVEELTTTWEEERIDDQARTLARDVYRRSVWNEVTFHQLEHSRESLKNLVPVEASFGKVRENLLLEIEEEEERLRLWLDSDDSLGFLEDLALARHLEEERLLGPGVNRFGAEFTKALLWSGDVKRAREEVLQESTFERVLDSASTLLQAREEHYFGRATLSHEGRWQLALRRFEVAPGVMVVPGRLSPLLPSGARVLSSDTEEVLEIATRLFLDGGISPYQALTSARML